MLNLTMSARSSLGCSRLPRMRTSASTSQVSALTNRSQCWPPTSSPTSFWGSSNGQYFPRYTYEKDAATAATLFDEAHQTADGWRRVDYISDAVLVEYQARYGNLVSADDVFFYTYAVLHEPDYRSTFSADPERLSRESRRSDPSRSSTPWSSLGAN